MNRYYRFTTRAGQFRLAPTVNGWHAWLGDDCFDGPYPTAQALAEDLANGHTAWPSCGDPARLGIPDDLGDWELIRS